MSTNALALQNVVVIDGTDTAPVSGATVVVQGERIERVLTSEHALPDGATTIDCAGKWLLPGLIDAHVHTAALSTRTWRQHEEYPPALLALLTAKRVTAMLDRGFTTVRDAGGGDIGMKMAVAQGVVAGPRMLIPNWSLTQTGGHGDKRGPAVPGDYHWEGVIGNVHAVVDGVEEMRKAVREQIRRGADQVKVFASGGALSPTGQLTESQYAIDELRVAVETASAAGKYIMAHAIGLQGIKNCIEAGVRSVEHGNLLDRETAERMAKKGTYLVPTVIAYDWIRDHPEMYAVTPHLMDKVKQAAEGSRNALKVAFEAGVKIGSGSDLLGSPFEKMGLEIALQAEVMGAHAAIIAATRTNAELLRLESDIGTIEQGKFADLIVVDEDPLKRPETLADIEHIKLVMKGGKIHKNFL